MRKKIKSSLWLKIFLLLTTLLFAVSILLYGTIMAVMPASYKYALTSNYTEQVSRLIADLEHHDLDDATQKIYEFCINNNDYNNYITYIEKASYKCNIIKRCKIEIFICFGRF